ncbi:hypothetical protein H5410_063984 [Solanum commersonii]|uniref:Uncharacterized protein n=1 Tax=Solanum commersonii TaxID=4109 RepID=A0A9J5W0R6_SOLCO|nr:hypothetical protein H5410_063984 [Solanum commersonii]
MRYLAEGTPARAPRDRCRSRRRKARALAEAGLPAPERAAGLNASPRRRTPRKWWLKLASRCRGYAAAPSTPDSRPRAPITTPVSKRDYPPNNGEANRTAFRIGRPCRPPVVREAPSRADRLSPRKGRREGESPRSSTPPHHAGAVYEAPLFGNAAQIGREFGPRLNTGETDSVTSTARER